MARITRRQARIGQWIALPLAVVASGAVIATASYSAFTAETDNAGNTFAAGSVTLTDNDHDSALFTATNLQPGTRDAACIVVTSDGSMPTDVRLFSANATTTKALDVHLKLTIEQGTGTATDCSDFTTAGSVFTGSLAAFTQATDHASGHDTWATTPGEESRTYRIGYELDQAAPNTTQGGTANLDLVWEAQTT